MTWKIRSMHSDKKANNSESQSKKSFDASPFQQEQETSNEILEMVVCGCGATKPVDMMYHIGDLETDHKNELHHKDEYACDACMERMVNTFGHESVYEKLGAPEEVLEKCRSHDKRLLDNATNRKSFKKLKNRDSKN